MNGQHMKSLKGEKAGAIARGPVKTADRQSVASHVVGCPGREERKSGRGRGFRYK